MCNTIGCPNMDNPPLCADCEWQRRELQAQLDALHRYADSMMDEIDAVQLSISSGTVACRLANEARYGFIAKSKSIRKKESK